MNAAKDAGEECYDSMFDVGIKGRNETRSTLGRAPQRSNCCVGQSPKVRGRSVLKVSAQALGERCVPQWPMMASVEACGRSRSGKASGLAWIHWTLCVCAHHPVIGMCQRSMGRTVGSFFFLFQKKPPIVPNSEAFNSFIGDGFQVPELKGDSESSDSYQAGNVNNEALHAIGLHGSGDSISLSLQDWELAKVALSFHMALDRVLGNVRSGKETWLVWVLSGPTDFLPFSFVVVCTPCAVSE